MYSKIFFHILLGFAWIFWIQDIFSAEIYRPPIKEVERLAAPCLPGGNGISLEPEKYSCPIGEFSLGSDLSLYPEVVKCSIQIALSFEKVDKKGEEWAKNIQKMRESDFNIWNKNIQDTTNSLRKEYEAICDIKNWTYPEAGEKFGCARTTNYFPETNCKDLAKQKTVALQNIGYIFAAKGTSKNYQNAKDAFLDKQKAEYAAIIDKWNVYKRRISNAVSKFNGYIKQAVK